ncbi:dihydrolipoyl dehydrogenase [Candidatus Micrarchaeota archaeon]|nr:dihydrolipoyl dehydrogenase [Candidatus Micrarchaeota archaeon]
MKKFDLIVIGSGSGLNVAAQAVNAGLNVAVVEKGPLGGTCLNRGCIPSKILIHSAEVAETIRNSEKFGIKANGFEVDFARITKRASEIVDEDSQNIEKSIREAENYTLFKTEAKFVGNKILQVGSEQITSNRIVIAAGTRSMVPKIEGLKEVEFMTSDEALRLTKLPKSMIIIGGGYIAAELAHFFGALGTELTIIEFNDYMLTAADAEVYKKFTEVFSKKYRAVLGHGASKVCKEGELFAVDAQNKNTKEIIKFSAEKLLIATGRVPNSDILDVAKSGIATDKKGYIATNEFLETNVQGVFAFGDIAGKFLFKHSANLEAEVVSQNLLYPKSKSPADYFAMPWAVFSSPQVAGVGKTEEQLIAEKVDFAVGKYFYKDTAMGVAMQEEDGFVKVMVDRGSKKILGAFIIGPDASTLIHEIIVAMRSGEGTVDNIWNSVHVHPALPEVVQRAFSHIDW